MSIANCDRCQPRSVKRKLEGESCGKVRLLTSTTYFSILLWSSNQNGMWVFANIFGSNAWFYSEILAHFFSSFFAGICLPHMPATSVPAAPWALVTFSATMYPTRVLSNLRPLYLALALVVNFRLGEKNDGRTEQGLRYSLHTSQSPRPRLRDFSASIALVKSKSPLFYANISETTSPILRVRISMWSVV